MPASFLAGSLVYPQKHRGRVAGICSCAFEWAVWRLMGVGGCSHCGCAQLFCLKHDGTQHCNISSVPGTGGFPVATCEYLTCAGHQNLSPDRVRVKSSEAPESSHSFLPAWVLVVFGHLCNFPSDVELSSAAGPQCFENLWELIRLSSEYSSSSQSE